MCRIWFLHLVWYSPRATWKKQIGQVYISYKLIHGRGFSCERSVSFPHVNSRKLNTSHFLTKGRGLNLYPREKASRVASTDSTKGLMLMALRSSVILEVKLWRNGKRANSFFLVTRGAGPGGAVWFVVSLRLCLISFLQIMPSICLLLQDVSRSNFLGKTIRVVRGYTINRWM